MGPISLSLIEPHPSAEKLTLENLRASIINITSKAIRNNMFEEVDDASRREKCFTTIAQLPAFIDPKQIPSKRSPFSTIQNHAFVHSVSDERLALRVERSFD